MPQYKTHASFNLLLALPLLVWGIHRQLNPDLAYLFTFTAAFAYGTLFMNPDLDLANQIKLLSLRGLLSLPFRLYSQVFRHRGISHSILWGTLSRILWLAAIIWIIVFAFTKIILSHKDFFSVIYEYQGYFIYGFVGLFLADVFHVLLDRLKKRG